MGSVSEVVVRNYPLVVDGQVSVDSLLDGPFEIRTNASLQ
jgi:hypothetical protein